MKNPFHLSFEFFPPKSEEGQETLHSSAKTLTEIAPDFFSVTFGAGGSTREGTIKTVQTLQENTGISVAPHLSCVGASREEIVAVIERYKSLGVKRLVALRGDLPSGMGASSGSLQYASQLVELIREVSGNHFHIEVAAYPEFHPQAKNAMNDILNFKKKIDAGANSALTQFFFNPDAYFYYLDFCAEFGINVPIVPGIMPITNFEKLIRFSKQCGAEIPRWICERVEGYKDDHDAIKKFGLDLVYDLCHKLVEGGAPGLHFYTMNKSKPSMELLKMLNLTNRKRQLQLKIV